jgi:hypothetical protein
MRVAQPPPAVTRIVRSWIDSGRPPQPSIAWPRERWIRSLPSYRELLENLPETLNRQVVAMYGEAAESGYRQAVEAFVAAMAWGYGTAGYGPWRTKRILDSTADSAAHLHCVAATLRAHGPLAAYVELSAGHRLKWLGPAFGTKYLYACCEQQPADHAVILDRLVAGWLRLNTGIILNPVPWSPPAYSRFLDYLKTWSAELQITPSELESCIFQAEARRQAQSQWAST